MTAVADCSGLRNAWEVDEDSVVTAVADCPGLRETLEFDAPGQVTGGWEESWSTLKNSLRYFPSLPLSKA